MFEYDEQIEEIIAQIEFLDEDDEEIDEIDDPIRK